MLEANDPSPHVPNEAHALAGLSTTFTDPDDVLNSPRLTVAEKREILATWASDAHAVPDQPALRQLDGGAIVSIDEVLAALRTLDGRGEPKRTQPKRAESRRSSPSIAHLALISGWRRSSRRHGRDDDDDDPPPCPASALPPGVVLELRRRAAADWDLAAA